MEGVEKFLAVLEKVLCWLPGVALGAISDPLDEVLAVPVVKDLLNFIHTFFNIAVASS